MALIPLTKGLYALVDDEDFERLNQWKWCAWKHRHTFYATRSEQIQPRPHRKVRTIKMHRFIMDAPDSIEVDHAANIVNEVRKHWRADNKAECQRDLDEAIDRMRPYGRGDI